MSQTQKPSKDAFTATHAETTVPEILPTVTIVTANQSIEVVASMEFPDTLHEQMSEDDEQHMVSDHNAPEAETSVTEELQTETATAAPTWDPSVKETPQEVLAFLRARNATKAKGQAAEKVLSESKVEPIVTLMTVVLEAADAQAITDETKDLISDLIKKSFATTVRVVSTLEQMELERKNWEDTEMAASHARLYAILTKCYQFYETMKASTTTKDVRKQMTQGLAQFIQIRGFKTLDDTHDMNRVVKAVFGEDRRRVSAYASVLRIALTAGPVTLAGVPSAIPVNGLAVWISASGGIEEIRKVGKTTGVTAAQRAETAKAAVADKPLMSFKPDAKTVQFSSDDADKMMVLIVTYRPTGELEINSVIKTGAVLRAALAAHYAANKVAMANVQTAATPKPQSAVSIALGDTTI